MRGLSLAMRLLASLGVTLIEHFHRSWCSSPSGMSYFGQFFGWIDRCINLKIIEPRVGTLMRSPPLSD